MWTLMIVRVRVGVWMIMRMLVIAPVSVAVRIGVCIGVHPLMRWITQWPVHNTCFPMPVFVSLFTRRRIGNRYAVRIGTAASYAHSSTSICLTLSSSPEIGMRFALPQVQVP